MSKKLFDILRIAQIIIPALGTFYAALASTWGLPVSEQVVATCGAVTALIGVILKIDSTAFFKGKEIIDLVE